MSLPALPAWGLAAACVAAAWAFFARRADRAAAVAAIVSVAFFGAARFADYDRAYQVNPLHTLAADGYVDVAGRLYRSPGREPDRDVLFVSVRTVTAGGEERAVRGRLRLGVPVRQGGAPPTRLPRRGPRQGLGPAELRGLLPEFRGLFVRALPSDPPHPPPRLDEVPPSRGSHIPRAGRLDPGPGVARPPEHPDRARKHVPGA